LKICNSLKENKETTPLGVEPNQFNPYGIVVVSVGLSFTNVYSLTGISFGFAYFFRCLFSSGNNFLFGVVKKAIT